MTHDGVWRGQFSTHSHNPQSTDTTCTQVPQYNSEWKSEKKRKEKSKKDATWVSECGNRTTGNSWHYSRMQAHKEHMYQAKWKEKRKEEIIDTRAYETKATA